MSEQRLTNEHLKRENIEGLCRNLLQLGLRDAATIVADQHAEIEQLRGNLSLAEDGLASATQEIEGLRTDVANLRQALDRYHPKCKAPYCIAWTVYDTDYCFFHITLETKSPAAEPEKTP